MPRLMRASWRATYIAANSRSRADADIVSQSLCSRS